MSERMTSERLAAAMDALENGQRQLDEDGVFVGVSRQAIHEVLAHLRSQTPPHAVTVTQDEMFVRCYLYDSVATFNTYADMHRAKGTPEGDEKAKHNQDMAKRGYEAFRKYMALTEKPAPTPPPLADHLADPAHYAEAAKHGLQYGE
jgi:hypothetical protein